MKNEQELVSLAVALGAKAIAGWSAGEEALAKNAGTPSRELVRAVQAKITAGKDPLGQFFSQLRSAEERRPQGATYTPPRIVSAMLRWSAKYSTPGRVVDPGVGSARFLVAAGRRFPAAKLVGIELDPLAAVLARAHLSAAGFAKRSQVLVSDFRNVTLDQTPGQTLFIGNPPYVRHHLIGSDWKAWFTKAATSLDLPEVSQLAGLHVHFFLATALLAKTGDYGAFITAAEWMDVNYGRVLRDLFVSRQLGGRSITLIEPTAQPFPDAATTASITCFEIGSKTRTVRLKRVDTLNELGTLNHGRHIRRERLEAAGRWTPLTRVSRKEPEGFVELGELCRVHRGQVTGANRVWIAGTHSAGLPKAVLFATVTKARELFAAGRAISDSKPLRRVIDIPVDLDIFDNDERKSIDKFLKVARTMGADQGYVAQNRKAWYAVGLRQPAPILATYMARRPPAFVLNPAEARHINIAHGVYPRDPMSATVLNALAKYLSVSVSQNEGRTYAGGLTKFEPKEMERLLVPDPSMLAQPTLLDLDA